MKTAKEFAEDFYKMIWNNFDSSEDLSNMFMEYGKQCAGEALKDARFKVPLDLVCSVGEGVRSNHVKAWILQTEIKTP